MTADQAQTEVKNTEVVEVKEEVKEEVRKKNLKLHHLL
jgi:hypothetical protein